MGTLIGLDLLVDFRVAIQAFQLAAAPQFVATGALGHAIERLVCL